MRLPRAILLVATAFAVVATLAYGIPLAVNDPIVPSSSDVRYVEKDGDYVAWVQAFAPRHVVGASFSTNGTLDRLMLLREGDIGQFLAGEPILPIEEFGVPAIPMGRIAYEPPPSDCPPPTGACRQESAPVLVFVRGTAWRGLDKEGDGRVSQTTQTITLQETISGGTTGPVAFAYAATPLSTARAGEWTQPLGLSAMGVGLAAATWWVIAAIRSARAQAAVGIAAPPGTTTEDMLRLARLVGLYVESIGRSFLVSALAIISAVILLLALALPALMRVAWEAYAYRPDVYAWTFAFFTCVVVYLGLVVAAHWAVSYVRVRRELHHWRALADRVDAEAARIIGA